MTEAQPTPVLVVEDLTDTRAWLVELAEAVFPGAPVAACADLESARGWLQRPLQAVLLDIKLPDGESIDFLATLKQRQPSVLVVMVTIYDDDDHLFAALRAGADGYLLKDETRAEAERLLRGMIAGTPPLSAGIARRVLRHFRPPAVTDGRPLTPRETDILSLIGKGYTTAQVSNLLGLSPHTTTDYIKGVYRKLGISNRAEAAMEAARLGLVRPYS